ncbi:MAG: hypothetical protein P8Y44_08595, partial [Acidobacteriota bacterium]
LAGAGEFRIGVGYESDRVQETYSRVARDLGCRVDFLPVTDWQYGNGVSALALARSFKGERFLLSMADHIFSPRMIRSLAAHAMSDGAVALAVDSFSESFVDLDDLTKVRIEANRIVAIGKDISPWHAGDTGLFLCEDSLQRGLAAAQAAGEFSLSDGIRRCAEVGAVEAVRVLEPKLWIDIDTPQDLETASAERAEVLQEIATFSELN